MLSCVRVVHLVRRQEHGNRPTALTGVRAEIIEGPGLMRDVWAPMRTLHLYSINIGTGHALGVGRAAVP